MEDYIEHVKSIVEALSIEKEPVGVKYTDEDQGVEIEKGNYTVCGAILAASEGKVIVLSEESCACSGGKTHLGLTHRVHYAFFRGCHISLLPGFLLTVSWKILLLLSSEDFTRKVIKIR